MNRRVLVQSEQPKRCVQGEGTRVQGVADWRARFICQDDLTVTRIVGLGSGLPGAEFPGRGDTLVSALPTIVPGLVKLRKCPAALRAKPQAWASSLSCSSYGWAPLRHAAAESAIQAPRPGVCARGANGRLHFRQNVSNPF